MVYVTTGLLLTTALSTVALSFFIVGAASVHRGWFVNSFYDSANKTLYRSWLGTVGLCVNESVHAVPLCPDYADYLSNSWISLTLLHGGRIALVFTILGVVLNAVASLFTGVIGRLTAWRFLHIRSRQDCIASVCALGAGCCGIIAVAVFYPLAKAGLPIWLNAPRPDYAWVLVLVGSILDILLAGATCMHVILPDVESPWYERPGSELEKSQERFLQQPMESDDDSEEDVALEPSWSRQDLPPTSPSSAPYRIPTESADFSASNVLEAR